MVVDVGVFVEVEEGELVADISILARLFLFASVDVVYGMYTYSFIDLLPLLFTQTLQRIPFLCFPPLAILSF